MIDIQLSTADVMWTQCRVGHRRHDRIQLGQRRGLFAGLGVPDAAGVFTVYDWPRYMNKTEAYCPGQDVISQSIDQTGVWERNETLLFIDVLRRSDPGLVIDFGCQIGWYSTLASMFGHEVAAVDVNAENLQLAAVNLASVATAPYQTFLGCVDESAPVLPATEMRVVKIDIEGAEQWAVRMLAPSLSAGLVDFLFMEVSPVFNDTYPRLFELLDGWGYAAYEIPIRAQGLWLDTLLDGYRIQHPESWLVNLHQADVLFIRKGLL